MNTFPSKVGGKISSRGWAIALGIGAIVLATILLIVYLDRYRARVGGANAPTQVLVANRVIPAGTPGTVVATQNMYLPRTLPRKEVELDAIADPTYLTGRAAAAEILPGQQLTALDFAADPSLTVDSQIAGKQRAISIAIDAIHGSIGQIGAGDLVDIYIRHTPEGGTRPVVELFRPAVKVLSAPGPAGGNFILRIDTKDAANFAFAADSAQFWFIIRPAAGGSRTPKDEAHSGNFVTR
jgi:pilus assembly protein CpaB